MLSQQHGEEVSGAISVAWLASLWEGLTQLDRTKIPSGTAISGWAMGSTTLD
ncbi:Neuroligin-4, X-linked [Sesbania bispinosa]|nr:Neuroligin-4, X-linked [Sesbania bispinosa]